MIVTAVWTVGFLVAFVVLFRAFLREMAKNPDEPALDQYVLGVVALGASVMIAVIWPATLFVYLSVNYYRNKRQPA